MGHLRAAGHETAHAPNSGRARSSATPHPLLAMQRTAGNAATVAFVSLQRQQAPTVSAPGGTFAPAATAAAYIALIREAERRLIAAGSSSLDDRVHILSGIAYGSDWSLDHDVEQSATRDLGFRAYTGRATQGDDPRPILGQSLFDAIKRSQDVTAPGLGRVDVAHLIIGLNARASYIPRHIDIPGHGATGLEIVTWVGDLGGATGRLARDRVTRPSTPASKYFTGKRGTDYGADSNLEGDVAAYVVAAAPTVTEAPPLSMPASNSIADSLAAYFTPTGAASREQRFLAMLGGRFSGKTLTNRGEIETMMAGKFASFGRIYLGPRYGAAAIAAANPHLAQAGLDVAKGFVDWLLRNGLSGSGTGSAPKETWVDRAIGIGRDLF